MARMSSSRTIRLLILAIAIALGVVEIIELVYLNRSAKLYE